MFLLAFCSYFRVYYLFGASIPAFWVPLVNFLCEIIRLSIWICWSALELNRINMHMIMWPFITMCHHATDIDIMCFCMSLKLDHNFCVPACTSLIQKLLYSIENSDSFKPFYKSVSLMVSLLQAQMENIH